MNNIKIKSPTETYNEYHKEYGILGGRKKVFEYFMDTYYKPVSKRTENSDTNTKLLLGRIYTFKYNPLYKDVLDYYDKRPLILVIDSFQAKTTKNDIMVGINLNFIPNKVRLNILQVLFKTFNTLITNDAKRRELDKYENSPVPLFSSSYDYYGLIQYIFETIVKSGYKYAIRSYIYTRIKTPNLIEYKDWGLIPLIESLDVIGSSVSDIHSAYWSNSLEKKLTIDKKKK